MEYTNRLNFPQYITDWLAHDDYDHITDPNTFSATTLLKPVKVYWLTLRNDEKLKMDVSDLAASKIGTAVHDSIETIDTEGVLKEIRLEHKMLIDGREITIRGKFDILEKQPDGSWTLRDIKTTSVWAFILGGKDDDYCKQMSIYRWLLVNDKTFKYTYNDHGFIDFFFTDWQSAKAKTDKEYPKHKINPGYRVKLMSLKDTEAFIKERVRQFVQYENTSEAMLPPCNFKDLWATEEKWAVKKAGATKATKLCDTEAQAKAYMYNKKFKGLVEYRAPKVKRCKYCSSFPFCQQGQTYASLGQIQF